MRTLDRVKELVELAGHQVDSCWEDDFSVYASSVKTCGPSTFNHPQYEVMYNKETKWMQAGNKEWKEVICNGCDYSLAEKDAIPNEETGEFYCEECWRDGQEDLVNWG